MVCNEDVLGGVLEGERELYGKRKLPFLSLVARRYVGSDGHKHITREGEPACPFVLATPKPCS